MGIEYEGRAKVGDCIRTPRGDLVEIVSIQSAGDFFSRKIADEIASEEPNIMPHSILALCCLYGEFEGREKRDYERWKRRLQPETNPQDFKAAS